MAFLLSGNMDKGAAEYQLEAAISKIFGSVSSVTELVWVYDLCNINLCDTVSVYNTDIDIVCNIVYYATLCSIVWHCVTLRSIA